MKYPTSTSDNENSSDSNSSDNSLPETEENETVPTIGSD